jgi:hypothetical protein
LVVKQNEFFRPGEFADNPPTFEQFWKAYPKRRGKRVGKSAALRLYLKLKPIEQCEAYDAAQHYGNSQGVKEGFARDASRFLASNYWRDWLDGSGEEVTERDKMIEELRTRAGARYEGCTLVKEGLESMHGGVTKWKEMPDSQLKRITEATR